MQKFFKYGMTKSEKIHWISGIILIGFMIAVFYHYVCGVYLGLPYPHNTFLFIPMDKFNDFFNMYNLTRNLNPYFEHYPIKSNYYPFANIVFYLFTTLPKLYSFFLFTCIFVVLFNLINFVNLKTENKNETLVTVFVFSFLTFPFLFLIDRGNIEGILFLFLYFFIYFKDKKPLVSSILLACAISLKVYPAVFLILFLSEKKIKETFVSILGVLILTFVSLLFHKGGFMENFQFIRSGFGINEIKYFANDNKYLLSGVSLFSPVKIVLYYLGRTILPDVQKWGNLLQVYSIGVLFLSGLLVIYVLFIEKQVWKKTAVLVFMMLLFPYISFDYKLINIFLPLLLYINSSQRSRLDLFYVSAFALLLIPKSYYFFTTFVSNSGTPDINIGVILNPLIMIAVLIVIIFNGIKNSIALYKQKAELHLANSLQEFTE
jgi:hypothetical protein